jgi:putative FmdB family regulatory protein
VATYEYEHLKGACKLGKVFDWDQPMSADPLTVCPECQKPVKRLISAPSITTTKSNAEVRDTGFTKLVRRDHGVYENVTQRQGESKIVKLNDPSTFPIKHIKD